MSLGKLFFFVRSESRPELGSQACRTNANLERFGIERSLRIDALVQGIGISTNPCPVADKGNYFLFDRRSDLECVDLLF
jgi:hypothetical protein